jgi:hypothetical protein
MFPAALWAQLHSSFDSDDGSLPEIAIVDLKPDEVVKLYSQIRESGKLADEDAVFWDFEKNSNRRVADVPNPAARVVARLAAGFTFVLEGISVEGEALPDLGFQVYESTIVVFYKMGEAWNAKRVYAFCTWLKNLVADIQDVRLDFSHGPSDTFPLAWREFLETT